MQIAVADSKLADIRKRVKEIKEEVTTTDYQNGTFNIILDCTKPDYANKLYDSLVAEFEKPKTFSGYFVT